MSTAPNRPDAPITTGAIVSADGTTIGYQMLGSGPGLLIIHGGGGRSDYYLPLAQALADHFTVYVMDRRGRGLSGPQGANYHIEQEYADVVALVQVRGISLVFGHSYGGAVALGAALLHPPARLALYEPALPVSGPPVEEERLQAIRTHLEQGDYLGAHLAFLQGSDVAESLHLTDEQVAQHFRSQAAANTPEWQAMVEILPTVLHEGEAANHLSADVTRYAAIPAAMLLLGGSASAAQLRATVAALQAALPQAQTSIIADQGHSAPVSDPEGVAALLRDFFVAGR